MGLDELLDAVAAANTSNNEGIRTELKVNAVIDYIVELASSSAAPDLTIQWARPEEIEVQAPPPPPGRIESFTGAVEGDGTAKVILEPTEIVTVPYLASMYGFRPGPPPANGHEPPAAPTPAELADQTRRSGAPLYEDVPEEGKLRKMPNDTLITLAERHGIEVPAGPKAAIVAALTNAKEAGNVQRN